MTGKDIDKLVGPIVSAYMVQPPTRPSGVDKFRRWTATGAGAREAHKALGRLMADLRRDDTRAMEAVFTLGKLWKCIVVHHQRAAEINDSVVQWFDVTESETCPG